MRCNLSWLRSADASSSDTTFDIFDYSPEVLRIADEIDPGRANVRFLRSLISAGHADHTLQSITPNITGFAGPSHNGKLIHYVGWADQLISPGNSLHYYETVHRFMTAHTDMEIDDFYRLFTVGGMEHWYVLLYAST